jgi:hypothetical protein
MKKTVWNGIQRGLWSADSAIKKEVKDETKQEEKKITTIKSKKKGKAKSLRDKLPDWNAFDTKIDDKSKYDNSPKIAGKFSYEDLLKSDYLPAKAYIEVSQTFLDEKNPMKSPQKSYEVLKLGAKRIGSNYRFLPYLIPAAKISGDIKLAEQYTVECSENIDSDFLGNTMRLLGKNEATNLIYPECVKGLGYDPLANKATNQNNFFPFKDLLSQ